MGLFVWGFPIATLIIGAAAFAYNKWQVRRFHEKFARKADAVLPTPMDRAA